MVTRLSTLVALLLTLVVAGPASAWPVIDVVSSVGGGKFPAVYTTTFTLTYDGAGDRYAFVHVAGLPGGQTSAGSRTGFHPAASARTLSPW